MRINIPKRGGNSGGFTSSGGTLTGPLILAGNPTQPLEAATKQYVDNGLAALNATNLTSGAIPSARLPAFTGDVTSTAGTSSLSLSSTGVTSGTYTKVTVDAKGRVTAGTTLSATDIPNLDWSKITTGKPTTLSGYGITNGVSKAGDTMTGPLTLSGNAANLLDAVPLQQVNALAATIDNDPKFIASGNIPNAGLTVGLNADGTVSVITGTIGPEAWGTAAVFNNAGTVYVSAVYDSTNSKVVIAYSNNGNNGYGTAIVGTVSGNSISFGALTVFSSTRVYDISAIYDPANNKVIIAYHNGSNGSAVVGTVSGTSISFGAPVVFNNNITTYVSAVYDSTNKKVVIAYNNGSNAAAVVGTVTGNTISFVTPVIFNSNATTYVSAVYDPTNNKVVIAYSNGSNAAAVVGTVSGTSISFGAPVVFNSNTTTNTLSTTDISAVYDSTNKKVVIAYRNFGNNSYGTAVVGTVSGTSISFGPPVVFNSVATTFISAGYDPTNNKIIIAYLNVGNNNRGTAIVGTVSGTSISFGPPVVFSSASTGLISVTYDSASNKVVIAYSNGGYSGYGTAIVYSPYTVTSNKNTFIGISQQSATNGSLVKVKIRWQVDSNQSGLTPGQVYYVSDNGTLTTTPANNFLAGVAVSANKLLITNWSIN